MYRRPDALIRRAPAQVAAHRRIDILFTGAGVATEQGGGGHDLSRLTIAALNDIQCNPGILYGLCRPGFDALYGGDFSAFHRSHRYAAAANWLSIQVDSAGAAGTASTPVFGAGQLRFVSYEPKQGLILVALILPALAIQGETDHTFTSVRA
jgi:hypothetical protein